MFLLYSTELDGIQDNLPNHSFCICQRFNAVVGPNGSGKSNIIDAMMFVFGKKATKVNSKVFELTSVGALDDNHL